MCSRTPAAARTPSRASSRYLHGIGCIHAPGARFSYCNAGFVVAGRLVEVLRSASYDSVLRDRIARPLGLRATGTLPEQAILHRAAAGHFTGADGRPRVVPVWSLQPSNAPAGATPFTTASELVIFARAHLDAGSGSVAGREPLLASRSARAMHDRHFELHGSAGSMADAWGLGGWMLKDGDGGTLVCHSGVTIGQRAWLDVSRKRRVVLGAATNGGDAKLLVARLRTVLLRARLRPASLAIDAAPPIDSRRDPGAQRAQRGAHRGAPSDTGIAVRSARSGLSMAPASPVLPLHAIGATRSVRTPPGCADDTIEGICRRRARARASLPDAGPAHRASADHEGTMRSRERSGKRRPSTESVLLDRESCAERERGIAGSEQSLLVGVALPSFDADGPLSRGRRRTGRS